MEVPDLGHSPSRGGGEVGNTEAARSEYVFAGSRGDRAGTAAHSGRTRERGAVRTLYGRCASPAMPGRLWVDSCSWIPCSMSQPNVIQYGCDRGRGRATKVSKFTNGT